MLLAGHLSFKAYTNWLDNPVVITLDDANKPVENMEYPAVTICREGIDMLAVDEEMNKQFNACTTH